MTSICITTAIDYLTLLAFHHLPLLLKHSYPIQTTHGVPPQWYSSPRKGEWWWYGKGWWSQVDTSKDLPTSTSYPWAHSCTLVHAAYFLFTIQPATIVTICSEVNLDSDCFGCCTHQVTSFHRGRGDEDTSLDWILIRTIESSVNWKMAHREPGLYYIERPRRCLEMEADGSGRTILLREWCM